MNYRFLTIPGASKDRPATARSQVVAVLAQEILDNPSKDIFRLESEHQLCRRFGVCRVTVRLALADLENRGLIYRKHGKGTFAHGRSTRIHRHIAVLIKSTLTTENRPLAEILRGVQSVMTSLRSTVILIGISPEKWQPELARVLAGVIVVAENVTAKELESLKTRKLPFFIVGETDLPGPRILLDQGEKTTCNDSRGTSNGSDFFTAGRLAAKALSRTALTGEPVSDVIVESTYRSGQTIGTVPNVKFQCHFSPKKFYSCSNIPNV